MDVVVLRVCELVLLVSPLGCRPNTAAAALEASTENQNDVNGKDTFTVGQISSTR